VSPTASFCDFVKKMLKTRIRLDFAQHSSDLKSLCSFRMMLLGKSEIFLGRRKIQAKLTFFCPADGSPMARELRPRKRTPQRSFYSFELHRRKEEIR
jgi:hypothetical protein